MTDDSLTRPVIDKTVLDSEVKVVDSLQRLKVCESCDKYLRTPRICGVCRCFMPIKTKLKFSKCPLGKW